MSHSSDVGEARHPARPVTLMKIKTIRSAAIIIASLGFSTTLRAGTVVIVSRPGASGWQFHEAEKIAINGRNKIRLVSTGKPDIAEEEYKRLPVEVIGTAPLRIHRGGYLVHRSQNTWVPALPDGISIKGSMTAASIWSSARIQVTDDKGSKGSEMATADIFAFLPGSATDEAVVDFLTQESNFTGVGEMDSAAAFEERMSLLVAVAGMATGPASDKLKTILLSAMDTAIQRSNGGIAKYADIEDGLRFAAVSERAFPTDARQKTARDQLRQKKAWLEQRIAILKAFSAAEQWDAFVDKYGDFERFDNSFEDIRKIREMAFRQSAYQHLTEGKRLEQEKQYTPALREIKLALLRNPNDREAADFAETVRIEEARSHADGRKEAPVDPKSPLQTQLNRHLTFAEQYIAENKFAEAESEIADAEKLDKDSSRVLLTRAKLLQGRKELVKALEVLDAYDRVVSADDQVKIGGDLRDRILFDIRPSRERFKAQIAKANNDGDYVEALNLARAGLQLDPGDVDFLYFTGLSSAVLRKETDGQNYLRQYLKYSESLLSDAKRRAEVVNLLPEIIAPPKEPQGVPNWFSGYNSPPGLFYCPISLMPNAHVSEIRSSRKETATFQWSGANLVSVRTVALEPESSDVSVRFDYYREGKGVRRVSTEPFGDEKPEAQTVNLTADGAVGPGKGIYVALFSNPVVNPYMVEHLTGKRVATLVAGNPYFHPFVWSGVHVFLAEYDSQGRVRSAKEIRQKDSGQRVLDFAWDGNRLMSVTERATQPGTPGNYRREMHYEGNRLTGEVIHFQGKDSRIDYKYNGDRLIEAECSNDPSIDGRSRKVTFRE